MKKLVKNNVYWVGKTDWELQKFHGEELSTHKGSTYNAYVVREEKTVLIDTVWAPFADEYVRNIETEIGFENIDAVICNHGEVDHSGALPALMKHIPDCPVYCTANAVKSLRGQYHEDWNFQPVKTGDSLDIGNGKQLIFVEMTMLHWPDSMATYLTGDNILFSNDAFGQHLATERLFNDEVSACDLDEEAMKYYANILTPFSTQLQRKLAEIQALNVPIDIIATSHGVLWRDRPEQIVEKYALWAADYQENQITVVYDSMWNGTRKLAESIAKGIAAADPDVAVKLFNIAKFDMNDVTTEVFKSKMLVLGSPTMANSALQSIAGLMHYLKGLKFKNKKAAAFGCYGWSGEAVKVMNGMLADAGFDVVDEGYRHQWNPDGEAIEKAVEFGQMLALK